MAMAMSSEMPRRELLLRAKLRSLVRAHWGDAAADAAGVVETGLLGGAVLATDDGVWVLAEDDPGRSLGPALAWIARHGGPGRRLRLLATADAGVLARRAAMFTDIEVFAIEETTLVAAAPDPPRAEPPVAGGGARSGQLRSLIERAGATPVVEHGRLLAEVRGLEVARVEGEGLAIGVGKHDREAHREVHGAEQTDEQAFAQLFEVVRIVADHRVDGGAGHAAFHLAPERWLRVVVIARPDLVGASSLAMVSSPVDRADLRHPAAAPAAGIDLNGEPVLVICSVGLDVDLVPAAADAWLTDGRRPRLVLCVPEGDDYAITREVAAMLSITAEVVTVPASWRALG